jgi:hypothetical protein
MAMIENNDWFLESMQTQLHDLYNNSFIYYYNEFKPQLETSGSIINNNDDLTWGTKEKI